MTKIKTFFRSLGRRLKDFADNIAFSFRQLFSNYQ